MADVDPDVCTPASVHVILGMTVWFVKVMRKSYRRIEALESASVGVGNAPAQFQERVEEAEEMAKEYETYLAQKLASKMGAVDANKKLMDQLFHQMNYHELMMGASASPSDRSLWLGSLELLREQLVWAQNASTELNTEQIKNESHLMEQLFVTKKNKEEMLTILKKHEGHSSRVVASAMTKNGVDENVYHKGSIDGNHCMILGQNGTKIVNEVTAEMKKVVKDSQNIEHIEKLDASLKEMFELWFEMMKIMKSTKRQSRATIARFKIATIALNKAILKFCSDDTVPGAENKPPTFLKAHLLFGFHIQDFFEIWETIGGLDEQSIEGTHPEFNQQLRQFGNTRGRNQKRQVVDQFLFNRASFVVNLIDEMLGATSTTKRPDTVKRGEATIDDDLIVVVEGEELGEDLTEMEGEMNNNALLHPLLENFPLIDTKISACKHCGKRLVAFAAEVHIHEYHSGSISNDADDGIVDRMKEEASI